ncbi:ribosome-binding factor A [Alienimonas californiensis]|uniref:Ribosome-binding factor A n=1 Tax=Alienimonas californiensis TaxID=2527989 RepID=A0A517P787_9PLAN|nr:ribosome-binding factor A [Alienimonas californiensis]QDT15246.1 hypothetical protein CA12_13290 [Alienimonas californiensis]
MSSKKRHRGQSPRGPSGGRRGPGVERAPDRKTLQLCGQVRKTLDYVLSGETGDDTLRQLYVADVIPAPDASRLLATLAPIDRHAELDAGAVMEKLAFAQPMLRSAVARAINRKKVPDLSFTLAGPAFGLPDPADAAPGPDPSGRGPTLDADALLAAAAAKRAEDDDQEDDWDEDDSEE